MIRHDFCRCIRNLGAWRLATEEINIAIVQAKGDRACLTAAAAGVLGKTELWGFLGPGDLLWDRRQEDPRAIPRCLTLGIRWNMLLQ